MGILLQGVERMRLINAESAIDAFYDAFCYAYCDNCEKEMNEDSCEDCHRKYQNCSASKKIIEKVINNLPSAEPEIIRCKDCENWDTTWQNDWAKGCHYCPLIDGIRNGDWYCADAERRTDE